MTKEQIAINRLMCGNTAHSCKADYIQTAIQALEEIQQYRAIGTVEEFKDLKEKSVAKKVVRLNDNGYYDYKCPTCGMSDKDCMGKKYCNCGQALET